MVNEIRIYVEGGGDGKEGKIRMREGFNHFLNSLHAIARSKRVEWHIIPCGPRQATYRNFQLALETHPDAFNVLLVDAEGSVDCAPWQHLYKQDKWQSAEVTDEQCHLMVQMMEAWFVVDKAVLKRFYGQRFNANSLPNNPNVEDIAKQILETTLKAATRNSIKGEYHKIRHGPKILAQLDATKVRAVAPHCDRLFKILAEKLDATV